MPPASAALHVEITLCNKGVCVCVVFLLSLETSKSSLNTNLCMHYKELLLLLACGYFNPLDEISFQSYLIYYIK